MSSARYRFLVESVTDLQTRLRVQGSELLIRRGHPEDLIPDLISKLGEATTVYAHADVCSEEMDVHSAVKMTLSTPGSRSASGGGCGDGRGENGEGVERDDKNTSGTSSPVAVMKEASGSTLHRVSDFPFDFPSGVPAVFSQVRSATLYEIHSALACRCCT